MKKRLYFLAVLTVSLLFAFNAEAAVVEVEDASGAAGEADIPVTINLGDVTGLPQEIKGIDLEIEYDPAVLTLPNADDLPSDLDTGNITSNWSIYGNSNNPGKLLLAIYSTTNLSIPSILPDSLCVINFDVASGASGSTNIVVTFAGFNNYEVPESQLGSGLFTVSGIPANNPPVLAPIGDKSIAVGATLSFSISATDSDDTVLTYSASNLPAGATFDTTSRLFSWTPQASQAGTHDNVHFEVEDTKGASDSEEITITVTAVAPTLHEVTISLQPPEGGSISPAPDGTGKVYIEEGESQTFTIDAATGYLISGIGYDGILKTVDGGLWTQDMWTFSNVQEDHTIDINFGDMNIDGITASAGDASGNPGDQDIAVGIGLDTIDTLVYFLDVKLQYDASVLTYDTTQRGLLPDGWDYLVTDSPAGSLTELYIQATSDGIPLLGEGIVFSIIFDVMNPIPYSKSGSPLTLTEVKVNDADVGAMTDGYFTVTGNEPPLPQEYTISSTVEPSVGGSISPSGNLVVFENETIEYTITANSEQKYYISSVSVDGTPKFIDEAYPTSHTHTFADVTDDHTIHAVFSRVHTISATAEPSGGGSISPMGDIKVKEGDSKTFDIQAASGYQISSVAIDGAGQASQGAVWTTDTRTFTNVTDDHAIHVVFSQIPSSPVEHTLTISVTPPEGGSAIPAQGAYPYEDGEIASVVAVENTGYDFEYWIMGDGTHDTGNTVDIIMTSDTSIEAVFAPEVYSITITVSSTDGNPDPGTVLPTLIDSAAYMEDKTYTIVPHAHYEVPQVLINDVYSVVVDDTITFLDITEDKDIHVTFAPVSSGIIDPQDFDESVYADYPYYLPLYGTVTVDGDDIQPGDWVGAYDTAGNCYGAGEYTCAGGSCYYQLSAYGNDPSGGTDGFDQGDAVEFRVYMFRDTGDILAHITEVDGAVLYYPDIAGGAANPVEANLVYSTVSTITDTIELKPGWNSFISIGVEPLDASVEAVFSDAIEHINLIRDHMSWWDQSIGGGNLTTISSRRCYYIHTDQACTFTVEGTAVSFPYTVDLSQGWNSVAYPYNEDAEAMARTSAGYTGFFKDMVSDISWMKGPDNKWCTPAIGDVTLKGGRGVFIKMLDTAVLTFEDHSQ